MQYYLKKLNPFPAELYADYFEFLHPLLRKYLRISFRKQGHGQDIRKTAQTFPAVPKILRKQLPTNFVVLAGNLNPWQIPQEIHFLRKVSQNPQVFPQKNQEFLVV